MSKELLRAVIAKLKAGVSLRRAVKELNCPSLYSRLYRELSSSDLIVRRGAPKRRTEIVHTDRTMSRQERLVALFMRDFAKCEYYFWVTQKRAERVPPSSSTGVMA